MADSDLLKEAKEAFAEADDASNHNRETALDDIRFARLGEQWPENILKQRSKEGRPSLVINKLPAFIRQVVNDARQNKPSIKVHPVDSGADPDTAEVINGLIRNIEYVSSADVAYDTGVECAVTCGFGYWRVGIDYAYDDTFDMDLLIKRVINPFSVYGDPYSNEADSSDWNTSFVVDRLTKKQFEAQWGDKAKVDWDDLAWSDVSEPWRGEDGVMVAEWWKREEVDREIHLFQDIRDGKLHIYSKDQIENDEDFLAVKDFLQHRQSRMTKGYKVTQHFMTGAEILESRPWPGKYIPIIPVYGEEIDVKGKRYFRSLIHNAKDPQRNFNYWRSAATELVALAPRIPFIGPKGAFDDDPRWQTANTQSHSYLEYTGPTPPQRQPLDVGPAAGALQEALNASDDMKAIVGLYDASLGARSNETSGRAILARQREGDVSTFHFTDNLARAIRHTGRVLIDLIPHVYTAERIIRIIGEDGKQESRQINAPYPVTDPKTGQPVQQPVLGPDGQPQMDDAGNPLMQPIMQIHDLTAGKYDLTVSTGPSYTTQREEAAAQMTEMIRAFPAAAPVVGPELAKNLDWPGADKIAEKLEQIASGQVPPQVQKQIEEGKQKLQQLAEENQRLKQDHSDAMAKIEADEKIATAKIESEKQIALAKIQAEQEIERYKAQLNAAAVASRPVVQAPISRPSA